MARIHSIPTAPTAPDGRRPPLGEHCLGARQSPRY